MSIHEIDRTSTLDPGAIIREDAEAEVQEIERDGEHRQNPAEQGVEPDEAEKEDQAPAAAPPTSATAAGAKRIFGTMRRPNPTAKKGNDAYNYEEKYPEDAIYEETTSNARVWRTYEDESRVHDANMVEESRDNVDVLLVFCKRRRVCSRTMLLCRLLYSMNRSSFNAPSPMVPRSTPSPLNPTISFVPATTDIWVNGLWFTSLFLNLTTALVTVLVKRWLHHYVALPSGTPRDRSFTRQFRYAGFQKWHVQAIIGLLPVLMHLALAIFLVGLVVFLYPLRAALSWIICAGTGLGYSAYVVATILPILFPQCPYRTPLCDLVYISLCRIVPRVTWYYKQEFLSSFRERRLNGIFDYLPHIQARNSQSLTMIESKFVQQMSANLAPEALHWLFSVSSNPTVHSIVIQSVGGLPMTSEGMFRALQDDIEAAGTLQDFLLNQCLQIRKDDTHSVEPVPGMEFRLERLLRVYPRYIDGLYYISPNTDSFELAVAISFNNFLIEKDGAFVSPEELLMNIISGPVPISKLPPRCWFHLARRAASRGAFDPLDPDKEDHTNVFPLHLRSAILHSFHASPKSIAQDFNSPLVLDFNDALPYFLDKIYDNVLGMFSKFVKHPSLSEPSFPRSLKLIVAVIEFLLHRLSLPESNMSHTIHESLTIAIQRIPYQTFSSQEATAVIALLKDIIARCVGSPLNIGSDWSHLCHYTIRAYQSLTLVAPSECSLRGLRSMVDVMTITWDLSYSYLSSNASGVLADLLAKQIPVAFTAFHDSQCLQFLGSHTFYETSVALVRGYVAGISTMQRGLDGAVDAVTLQSHIDYIHHPQNLFTACSILATHGVEDVDRSVVYRDIMALVQLRPRDAAWEECRRKLHDLVEGDGRDFFNKQLVVWGPYFHNPRPLRTDEIQVENENIRYVIHALDDIFDGGAHTMVPTSPVWLPTGRIGHFLRRWLGRKLEVKLEQGQQV
ncbi:hypothetical protein EDD85DRAFT_958727 [Armillaria nabsnona]|nr:hypothetical protein EDD85DRAFT_958727 [Armillaria nabsnona]